MYMGNDWVGPLKSSELRLLLGGGFCSLSLGPGRSPVPYLLSLLPDLHDVSSQTLPALEPATMD